jgi:hypothetical protein
MCTRMIVAALTATNGKNTLLPVTRHPSPVTRHPSPNLEHNGALLVRQVTVNAFAKAILST